MESLFPELTRRFPPNQLLGYLNFADGRPDGKFRKGVADLFAVLVELGAAEPWKAAGRWLLNRATELEGSGPAALRDLAQAKAVIPLAFEAVPAAYRGHHADLLAHQPDWALFNAFFLARCCEVALAERAAGTGPDDLPAAAVLALNDYVGYRPIAVLETRPQTDYYPHEKVAPVPLFVRGAGVAPGRYADILRPALELLDKTDRNLLREASYDPEKLEELTLDPRAVDHFHPVSKRPSMLFGEWDPHRIDGRGYFRRFVLRQPTLDALLEWATPHRPGMPALDPERLFESAAVLAGTVLMGAGMSGSGPTHYDSSVTLAALVGRIARYRDEFYQQLLKSLSGPHGERLRAESAKLKQPFAGVRQFLNQAIAGERALHLQERRLGVLFAAMGYPAAARDRAARIPAPSARLGCEVRIRQTEAGVAVKANRPADAARLLGEAEDLLRRGIDCGALIDPWNILGYQGLFPTFPGRADTVRDPRAEELILTIGRQLDLYAQGLSAAAAVADPAAEDRLRSGMRDLAAWWDRFATPTVTDLPRVYGGERAEAADHVARALALWKAGGAADPGFWRKHRDGFKTPAAYAQVIDALLDRPDPRAALALLVTWLSDADTVPLQDPAASFVRLAFRWLRAATTGTAVPADDRGPLVRRFFELLEANAEDRWTVPDLGLGSRGRKAVAPDDADADEDDDSAGDDDAFASAYEGMTFKDSADDGTEGAVADEGGPAPDAGEFPLDADADRAEDRLRFLAAVARLWRAAARPDLWPKGDAAAAAAVGEWLRTARGNLSELRGLAERLNKVAVPEPAGGVEGVMEYDRRRAVKGHLLELTVQTAVEMAAAARALAAALPKVPELGGKKADTGDQGATADLPAWEAIGVRLERAVASGEAGAARRLLPGFVSLFRHEPLLVSPPADGGPPTAAVRAQMAQQQVESLLARLPRLGLLRETFHLTKLARLMERNDPPEGRRVSSFDQLFRTAVVGVVDALLASARDQGDDVSEDGPLASALRQVAEAFHGLWLEHSQSLRLSALESVLDKSDWEELRDFVRKYGGDLFTVRFLTLSNVRGILGQGAAAWLDREVTSGDPDGRPKLVTEWEAGTLDKPRAARLFETVLQALVEHYDEYRDYNTTTTQSDYGENLYILLDYLRLQASYDRYAWRLRPLNLAHERLCRKGFDRLAAKWREFVAGRTQKLADDLLADLAAREAEHGIKLRTVRDRLEERFVQPLRIDQAAARVTRAAAAAKDGQGEDNPAFSGLLAAIGPLADHPAGVGLDVPAWLRRLEDELRKTRNADPDGDADPSSHYPFPAPAELSFDDLKRQLRDWDKPIGGD